MKTLVAMMDVESVGLHGEAFAIGAVLVDLSQPEFTVSEECYFGCPPDLCAASQGDRAWLTRHCIAHCPVTVPDPRALRAAFWRRWMAWYREGVLLCADCAWPVEARFLARCVDDALESHYWQGPYPLLDVASILWVLGVDPTQTFSRLPDELPQHNPLADARQSAHVLHEAWQWCIRSGGKTWLGARLGGLR